VAPDSPDNSKIKSLHEIFQQQAWCLQVEPTQSPGRIVLVMTKAQVLEVCKLLDRNLEALFKIYLPCNPQFKQSTNIPCWLDMIPTSDSMMNYTQALFHSIPSLPSNPNKDKKYACKPVPHQSFCLVYDQQEFPTLSYAKSMPISISGHLISGNSNISAAGSFSSDQQSKQAQILLQQ